MPWQHRRVAYYVALLTGTTLVFTLAYNAGMATWEGRPQTLIHSLEVVLQTFTTTGYGEDAPWASPEMHLLVIGMQVAGVALILTAADVFVVPFLREAFAVTPPTSASGVDDHVVVCGFTPRGDALIDELGTWGVPAVVVEPDRDRALELHEAGYTVVAGDPTSVETLEAALLDQASALVADASDEENASIVLSARQIDPDVPVVSLVEDSRLAAYHRYAGATQTLSPRQLLGERLAGKVTTMVRTDVGDGIEIGDDFEVAEVSVQRDSDICDRRLEDTRIVERTGANVVGAWFNGEFASPLPPRATIDENTILLVTGTAAQLEALREMTHSPVRPHAREGILLVGLGETGSAARDALADAGLEFTVLDVVDRDGVDVVGDATDPDVLRSVDIEGVETVILTLGDDTAAIFATLIVHELRPTAEIIARASETENVRKLYQAGADYVLALARVSGRMLASVLLEDEEVLSADRQIRIVRTTPGRLAGRTVGGAAIRTETGCTVVAVERGGDVLTDVDPAFELEADDEVVVAGTDESIERFTRFVR